VNDMCKGVGCGVRGDETAGRPMLRVVMMMGCGLQTCTRSTRTTYKRRSSNQSFEAKNLIPLSATWLWFDGVVVAYSDCNTTISLIRRNATVVTQGIVLSLFVIPNSANY
jgi:hypothetical protein